MAYRIIEHHSQSTGHFYRLEMNLCGQFLQELMLPHAAQLQNVSNFVGSLDNENKLIRRRGDPTLPENNYSSNQQNKSGGRFLRRTS
jgi:hypothetical protein